LYKIYYYHNPFFIIIIYYILYQNIATMLYILRY